MSEDPSKTSAADVQLLTVECAAAYSEICYADAQIRIAVFYAVFFWFYGMPFLFVGNNSLSKVMLLHNASCNFIKIILFCHRILKHC